MHLRCLRMKQISLFGLYFMYKTYLERLSLHFIVKKNNLLATCQCKNRNCVLIAKLMPPLCLKICACNACKCHLHLNVSLHFNLQASPWLVFNTLIYNLVHLLGTQQLLYGYLQRRLINAASILSPRLNVRNILILKLAIL